ncbi:MAG TPA: transposase [Nostocaceae cyanobacterium]|nr:transposase [Nostocaceae cyanobacterium]
MEFNGQVIEEAIPKAHRKIAVTDCSFIHKSGQKTYGIDYFYNSIIGKASLGLEISAVAIVDVDANIGYSLSVKQTPPTKELKVSGNKDIELVQKLGKKPSQSTSKKNRKSASTQKKEPEETRVDEYLKQMKEVQPHLPSDVGHLVCDGFYAKEKFVTGVKELQLDVVSKLRTDANLKYLYTGPQKSRGARRKYDGKVHLNDISKFTFVCDLEPQVKLYTCVVFSVCLKRQIRLAYILDCRDPNRIGYVVLFSTDLTLDALSIYRFYKARFQIEFIFRDAKQFLGLEHCQARDQQKLDFHFHACLTALNLAKLDCQQLHVGEQPFVFSASNYKRLALNSHLLDVFISKLDLDPNLIKNHPNYPELCSYGAIAA